MWTIIIGITLIFVGSPFFASEIINYNNISFNTILVFVWASVATFGYMFLLTFFVTLAAGSLKELIVYYFTEHSSIIITKNTIIDTSNLEMKTSDENVFFRGELNMTLWKFGKFHDGVAIFSSFTQPKNKKFSLSIWRILVLFKKDKILGKTIYVVPLFLVRESSNCIRALKDIFEPN